MKILVGSRKHLHCESLVTNWTPVQTQCKHKLPNPKMEQCDNSTYAHIVKSTTYNPGEFMPTISMSSMSLLIFLPTLGRRHSFTHCHFRC